MTTIDSEPKASSSDRESSINFDAGEENSVIVDFRENEILVLDSVLTESECAQIREMVDDLDLGEKRSKLCLKFTQLSEIVVSRCAPYIPRKVFLEDKYIQKQNGNRDYDGNEDQHWIFTEINPNWRLVKCPLHSQLTKHFDGTFVKSVDCKSIYTIMIYLNDADGDLKFDSSVQVAPKMGRIAIFDQKLMHEGLENINYTKYFIRSELMFQREVSVETAEDRLAMELYCEAKSAHSLGKNQEAERLEERAFEISPILERLVLNL